MSAAKSWRRDNFKKKIKNAARTLCRTLHNLSKEKARNRSRSMSQKILELAQVHADIRRAELSVDLLHATGAQPPPGVPGVDVLEAVLNSAKHGYIQQLCALSPSELAEFFALIS